MSLVPVVEGEDQQFKPIRLCGDSVSKKTAKREGQRVWHSQQGTCFACVEPWVLVTAPHKLDLGS